VINRAYRQRPFQHYAVPIDLDQRGLAPEVLPQFPYRDDAQLLWQAIARYASSFLQRYYADDASVQQDAYLQAWAAELGAPLNSRSQDEFPHAPSWLPRDLAVDVRLMRDSLPDYPRVPDFPNPQTPGQILSLQELIDVATTLIFTCSAQHAAVNFSQFDYFGYVPNAPFAAYIQPDTAPPLANLMPPDNKAVNQMVLAFALSGIVWSRLGDSAFIPFTEPGDVAILQQFQRDLETIETEIHHRNQKRQQEFGLDYPYLLPSRIPNSINI
jgi:arachidonate 15-lipoxygenase